MKKLTIITLLLTLWLGIAATAANERIGTDFDRLLKGRSIAWLYSRAQKYEEAERHAEALACLSQLTANYSHDMTEADLATCARAYCLAGDIYYKCRQYSTAMNQYLSGLRLSELNSLDDVNAQIYTGIGNLYSSHADFEMSLRYYRRALRLAGNSADAHLRNSVLNNLVGASCFAGNTADGKRYLDMLKANRERNRDYAFNLMMCEGLVASFGKSQLKAVELYRRALRYAEDNRLSDSHVESVCSCLAQLYLDLSEPDSAMAYLRRNEALAKRNAQTDLLTETVRSLSAAYDSMGDKRRAAEYKARYVELADSLYNDEEYNAMKNALFLYEAKKSEDTITSLTHEKQSRDELISLQRWGMALLVAVSAAVLAFILILYRKNRQLNDAYRELYNRSLEYLAHKDDSPITTHEPAAESTDGQSTATSGILSAEQRGELLRQIGEVMERTDAYCQSDFSIETLASLVGSNSRYVSEAINEGYGKNFRTFLNEYRIKEAMRRLADTRQYGSLTIKAISESVGYKSQANFIAVFTKIAGMKPSIYQKMSRGA